MTPPSSELVQWLPADLPVEQIAGWVHLGRSFDRVNGETLVVRYRAGRTIVLTRPDAYEVFRELPLVKASGLVILTERPSPVLQARVIDGRVLTLPLYGTEPEELSNVLDDPNGRSGGSGAGRPGQPNPQHSNAAHLSAVGPGAPANLDIASGDPGRGQRSEVRANPANPSARLDEPYSGDQSALRPRPGAREPGTFERGISGFRSPETVRPPVSADVEVVRVPRTVRPAINLPQGDESSGRSFYPETDGGRGNPFADRRTGQIDVDRYDSGGRGDASRPFRTQAPPGPRGAGPSTEARRKPEIEGDHIRGPNDSVHPPQFSAKPLPIVRTARDIDALRASFQHHWGEGALDEASQVARALLHLGKADVVERRLAELRPDISPEFATPLTPYLFRAYLAHDDEDPDLGRLLAAIAPAYLHMRARPEHEAGLHTRDEVDPQTSLDAFVRLFGHAARAFGLPCPRLFLRRDVAGGMAHLHLLPVASLCGGTLAGGFDSQSTLHVLGHHMSLYRPEVYLYALAPAPADQHALVLAALHLEGRLTVSDRRVAVLADTLGRHMGPSVRETLRQACNDLALPSGEEPRLAVLELIRRSRRAAFLTAVRAGFALSGSLSVSDQMQRMMPAVPGVTLDEMLDDLVTYSVSPSWMALRKELGLAFDPSGDETKMPIG